MRRRRGRERESENGEVNGMATNHLQGRLGSPQEDGRLSGKSLSDTNFVPPDGNTQKLAAFVVFGILTVFKYFHIFPGAFSLDVDMLNMQICGTTVPICIYLLHVLSYCTYSHASISFSACTWKSHYNKEE